MTIFREGTRGTMTSVEFLKEKASWDTGTCASSKTAYEYIHPFS
jgi:hypothetical protein